MVSLSHHAIFNRFKAFFTNKLALTYKLENVWQLSDNNPKLLPSISYLNEPLANCSINTIQIQLVAEDRTAEQFGLNQWGPRISVSACRSEIDPWKLTYQASATCSVVQKSGATLFNLTSSFDLLPSTMGNGQQQTLLAIDPKLRANLWWGQSLL